MTKLILAIVMAASAVLGGASRLVAESAKPNLAWMKGYVGKPSWAVVANPQFDIDGKAYLPPARMPWGDKGDTPQHAAVSTLEIPQTVYAQGDFVIVGGCAAHACGLDAVLIAANTNPKSPSLTLAFATPATDQDGTALYIDSSEPLSTVFDPPKPEMFRTWWLQGVLIEHIVQTLFATKNGFSTVPTPDFLKPIPSLPQEPGRILKPYSK